MGIFRKIMGFLTDVLNAGRKVGLWALKRDPLKPYKKE